MDTAFNIAVIIISIVLMLLVVLQARTAGLSNRDTSAITHTRRGLEKTLHQTTIVVAVIFLLLALVSSLPIFGSVPVPTT